MPAAPDPPWWRKRAEPSRERKPLTRDAIVDKILSDRLDEPDIAKGFILDGYPRTAVQADSLDRLLDEKGLHLDHVIELEVDEDALVARIAGRFSCAKCNTPYHDSFKQPVVAGVCDVCGSREFKRRSIAELRGYGFDLQLAFEDDRRNYLMFHQEGVPCVYIHSGYYD